MDTLSAIIKGALNLRGSMLYLIKNNTVSGLCVWVLYPPLMIANGLYSLYQGCLIVSISNQSPSCYPTQDSSKNPLNLIEPNAASPTWPSNLCFPISLPSGLGPGLSILTMLNAVSHHKSGAQILMPSLRRLNTPLTFVIQVFWRPSHFPMSQKVGSAHLHIVRCTEYFFLWRWLPHSLRFDVYLWCIRCKLLKRTEYRNLYHHHRNTRIWWMRGPFETGPISSWMHCEPPMLLVPRERQLLEKWRGRGFTLLRYFVPSNNATVFGVMLLEL